MCPLSLSKTSANLIQAIRNSFDATCIQVPDKFKKVGDFHEYYSGHRVAPFLTLFCGGNHEVSNYLFELYYGGWVAYNIYYLGAANIVRLGPLRISGMSGIWKPYDYQKPHYERLPYNYDDVRSAFHVRELDVRKLLQVRTQVDIGLSHDWPRGIENFGDHATLFRKKRDFLDDSLHGRLGNPAAREVLDRLRPAYWFSAHLHVMFAASVPHDNISLRPIQTVADEPTAWAVQVDAEAARHQQSIAAWNAFPAEAQRAEKEAGELFLQQFKARSAEARSAENQPQMSSAWKPVKYSNSGERCYGDEVIRDDVLASKAPELDNPVQNDDEINLSSSDESTNPSPVKKVAMTVDAAGEVEPEVAPMTVDGACDGSSANSSLVDRAVAENVRNKLPASLSRPTMPPKLRNAQHVPSAVHNKLTKFLALDKFNNRDPYIKLVEVQPISSQGDTEYKRPFRLQYDKEWLAITRVFANDLHIGDPDTRVPQDLGEEEYLKRIVESEEWVEENIVQRGLLNIPHNFSRTAPKYDPDVPITTTQMAQEYTNIQTTEFCELLGIPNKFDATEEERAERMSAGPRPSDPKPFFNRRGRGNHRGNRRGGRRGGGRGGGRGGQTH